MKPLAIVLVTLVLSALAPAGGSPAAGGRWAPVLDLDLSSAPRLSLPAAGDPFEPRRVRLPGAAPGWVVRVDRQRPAELTDDRRLEVSPSPAVLDGLVFLGGGYYSRKLWALDAATGRRRWEVPLDDKGPSAPAVTPREVVTNTESCTTYSVDPATGRTFWKRWLGPSLPTPPVVSGKRVLTCLRHEDGSYAFAALDRGTGETVWETPLDRETVGTPVVALGRIFLTLATREAVCLDERSGRKRWQVQVYATSAPVLGGGGLYYAALVRERPEIVRLDPLRGAVVWTTWAEPLPEGGGAGTTATRREGIGPRYGWADDPPRPAVVEPFVALGAGREIVLFGSESGEVARRLVLPEGRSLYAPPALLGSRLLFVTTDGLLFEVEPETGAVRRSLDIGAPVTSGLSVSGGRVYLMSKDLLVALPWSE